MRQKIPQDDGAVIPKQPRITAINLVRVFVIALVIATHIAASGALYNTPFSGFVWMVSHASRFLFIILTALVLTYNYGPGRPFQIKSFYIKRFTLIALPYATWTLIYQLREGLQQHSVYDFLNVYVTNFITANAMYHLYFLLITMQLYLLFPLLRYLYGKIKRPWRLFSLSLSIQIVIMALMQYWPDIPGLSWWLHSPANYVWTYQFFIVCGMLIATHIVPFRAFTMKYLRPIGWSALAATLLGFGIFGLQWLSGTSPDVAAAVFQPYIVVTSISYGLFVFGLGFRWVERGEKLAKPVAAIAEDSFGIYLSHVLFLTSLSQLQPAQNGFLVGVVTLIIGLPVVYGIAFLFSEIARRTPFSIFLTGRHWARVKKV